MTNTITALETENERLKAELQNARIDLVTVTHWKCSEVLNNVERSVHENAIAHGFYDDIHQLTDRMAKEDPKREAVKRDFVLAQLAKIASEVGEAVHAIQHDDGTLSEELADIIIRTLDLMSYLAIDAGQVVLDKMSVNANRPYKHDKTC